MLKNKVVRNKIKNENDKRRNWKNFTFLKIHQMAEMLIFLTKTNMKISKKIKKTKKLTENYCKNLEIVI